MHVINNGGMAISSATERYGDAFKIQQNTIFVKNTYAIGLKHFVQQWKKFNI